MFDVNTSPLPHMNILNKSTITTWFFIHRYPLFSDTILQNAPYLTSEYDTKQSLPASDLFVNLNEMDRPTTPKQSTLIENRYCHCRIHWMKAFIVEKSKDLWSLDMLLLASCSLSCHTTLKNGVIDLLCMQLDNELIIEKKQIGNPQKKRACIC